MLCYVKAFTSVCVHKQLPWERFAFALWAEHVIPQVFTWGQNADPEPKNTTTKSMLGHKINVTFVVGPLFGDLLRQAVGRFTILP